MDKSQLPKMLKKLHLYLLLLCSLIGFGGYAQTYPISITTQVTQPSPIYLSNYADATTVNSPIKIQIVLNDLTISNRQVKLKIYFQGNGISFTTNDFVVGARPLYLEGGFPLQLTNVDLAPYFEFQNLLGLNPNQYAQALPEGIYNIYVEVYDFATGKKLSSKTRTNTIIFQNEPPFLNLPLNNASIMQQNIQNIIFSWTPRSINVSNVEYEFSLVEIWDKYTPIQNAFAYSPPLYTTTTRATTLQYSMSEPQLIPGKKYAWRIKAKAILGAEEIGVFKNNGYSEIFSFDYEVSCTPPLAITTSGVSENQAKIAWSGNIDNYDYQVNYREKNANSEWYKQVTPRENITLSNLKPNTVYEYTVGSSCDPGKYTHSTIKEFTTVARDEIVFASCGIKPDPNDLSNTTPLPNLYQNDVVTAGDFPIVVIKATGSNGTFTGEGYVTFPFIEKFRKLIDAADNLKEIANKGAEITGKVGAAANATANLASNTATKVSNGLDNSTGDSIADSTGKVKDKVAGIGEKVNNKAGEIAEDIGKYSTNIGEYTRIRITFNNIGVNTDFKLISGEIIASYDPTWKNIVNLDNAFDEVFGSNGKPIEGKFDYEVVSVVLNADGSTTVTGKDGQISTIAKSPYERVYTDSTGKVVTIPANGAGAPLIANAAAGGKATAANTNGMSASGDVVKITSPDVKITFKNGEKSQYAFDVLPDSGSQKLKDTYETIPMEGGGIYNVNYKAVSDLNGPETFIAEAEFKNGKTIKDVVFKTNAGADVNFKWNDSNTEAVITVTKTLNFSKESIIAIVKGATQKDPQDPAKTIEGKSDIAGKVNLWQLAQKPVINVTILSINGANAPSADSAKDFLNEVYNKVGIKFDVTVQDLTIGALPAAIQCGDSGLINFYSNGQIDIKNQIEANPNFTYNSETYYVIYTGKPGQDGYKGFMPLGGQYAFVFSDGDLKTAAHELGHGIFGLKHPFATKAESGKTDLLMDYGTGTVLSHNDWDIIHSGGWKFYGFQKSSSGALAGGYGITPNFEFISAGQSNIVSTRANLVNKGILSGFLDAAGVRYLWNKDKNTYKINGDKNLADYPLKTKKVLDKDDVLWLVYDYSTDCNVIKYVRTTYGELTKEKDFLNADKVKSQAALEAYIDKINKVSVKENSLIYSAYLGCTNYSTENVNNCLNLSNSEITANIAVVEKAINDKSKTFSELETIFKGVLSTCLLEKLPFEIRSKILEKYYDVTDDAQWEISYGIASTEDHFFIKDVFLTTPENQQKLLIEDIKNKNYKWVTKLFDQGKSYKGIGNDVNYNQVAEIFLTLGKWAITNYESLKIEPTKKQIGIPVTEYYPGRQPFLLGPGDYTVVTNSGKETESRIISTTLDVINGRIYLYNKYNLIDLRTYVSAADSPSPRRDATIEYKEDYNPFEPITIIAGTTNKFGLEVGKEYVVPSIVALAFQGILKENFSSENLRKAGNSVMIVSGTLAAPFSGGGSLVAVAASISTGGIAVGLMDNYIQTEIKEGRLDSDSILCKAWDDIYISYSILDGAGGVGNLAFNSYRALSTVNFLNNFKKFEGLVNAANNFKSGSLLNGFNEIKSAVSGGVVNTKLLNSIKVFNKFDNFISPFKNFVSRKATYGAAAAMLLNISIDGAEIISSANKVGYLTEFVINSARAEAATVEIMSQVAAKTSNIAADLDNAATVSIKTTANGVAQEGKIAFAKIDENNVIFATKINNKIVYNIIKMSGSTPHFYQSNPDSNNSDPSTKCSICPERIDNKISSQLCLNLERLQSNTNNLPAISKLCGVANLNDFVIKLLELDINKGQKVFLNDITLTNHTLSNHIPEYNSTTISNWALFNNNQKEFARKDWNSIVQIGRLNDEAKTEILKFSDATNTKSTLKEFTTDMDKVIGFTDFVNNNIEFTKGFLGHKQKPIYEDIQYELLTPELIGEIPLGSELDKNIRDWIQYSEQEAKRRNNFKEGTEFEEYIEKQLKNTSSRTYLALKEKFGTDKDGTFDLDHRSIYTQVQFCINDGKGIPCSKKGDFFIADFVFVREIKNPITGKLSLNVKIADTKLSKSTNFTANQIKANGLDKFIIKAEGKILSKKDETSIRFQTGETVQKTEKILKIYSNGSGDYEGLTY